MLLWTRNVYLDHNATTPIDPDVRAEMARVLRKTWGNPSSLHTHGRAARGLVNKARESVSGLLGCPADKVLFTSGGTEANNSVIKGVFQANGNRGHIITTAIEHESVLGACRQVEQQGGEVTYLTAGRDGLVDHAHVKAAIRPETILISVMHANNETGAVQPVEEIGRIAYGAGIPFHTDAVQSFGKLPTLVDRIGCEFLSLSAHKINGPKGIGALYWRGGHSWMPLVYGGDQELGLRAGTEGVHQVAGLGKAAELAGQRMDGLHARLSALRQELVGSLQQLGVEFVVNEAPPDSQLPGTLSLTFPGREGIRLLAGLDCYEVSVSIGSACTADRIEPSHVMLGMGMDVPSALSTIRLSMGATTTGKDIHYVAEVLKIIMKDDPEGFSYLDPQKLTKKRIMSEDTFIIDLRFPYERALSPSVPGASEWSHIYFERYFKRIPWDKEVILMCGTGIFSFAAGYRLARAGHKRVRVVYGGYAAWRALYPDITL